MPTDERVKSKLANTWETWTRRGYIALAQLVIAVVTVTAAIGALYFAYQSSQVNTTAERVTAEFTEAKELIGSQDPILRAAGIHAVGRIAKNSPSEQLVMLDILAAYVRVHAPLTSDCSPPSGPDKDLATDLQTALGVLGQFGGDHDHRIDLTNSCLHGANLRGAKLRWADLTSTNLTNANLNGADLAAANLTGAQLNEATMVRGTNLNWAILTDANLNGAILGPEPETYLQNITYYADTIWPADFTPPPSRK
jgi:hypothetical protein